MQSWPNLVIPRSWLEGYVEPAGPPGSRTLLEELTAAWWPSEPPPLPWSSLFVGLLCPACGSRMDEIEEDDRGALVRHARRRFPCRVRSVDPDG